MALAVLGALAWAASAIPARADFAPRPVREGTLSIGLYGLGGALVAGSLSETYDTGLGFAVRLRYRTARESALGLSFESQRYNAKQAPQDATDPEWVTVVNSILEYQHYFRVQKRGTRYLSAGVGLAQLRRRLESEETDFPGDGAVFALGAGTEIWWGRSLTVDLGLRYNGMLRSVDGISYYDQAIALGLGFQFYTSR
jgi:opacity protein-like surface antigen